MAEKRKIPIVKIVFAVILIALGAWVIVLFGGSLKDFISMILGGKKRKPKIRNIKGEVVGEGKEIISVTQDGKTIVLEDGSNIDLPEGIKAKDIEKIVEVEMGVYDVQVKSSVLTDVLGHPDKPFSSHR